MPRSVVSGNDHKRTQHSSSVVEDLDSYEISISPKIQVDDESADDEDPIPVRRYRSRTRPSLPGTIDSGNQHGRIDNDAEDQPSSKSLTDSDDDVVDITARPQEARRLDSIRPSEFVYPRSQYKENIPPLPRSVESKVVEDFMAEVSRRETNAAHSGNSRRSTASPDAEGKDFVEFDLNDFSIYLPESAKHYGGTMVGLQNLGSRAGNSALCFDGVLSIGGKRRYVQNVQFNICSIGNYGQDMDGVGDNLWIQSVLNKNSKLYYRLKVPSDVYHRYHEGFVWLANLAKHFVDYTLHCKNNKNDVSIHNFKSGFAFWLHRTHVGSDVFREWYRQYNRHDFRVHITANINFLWKEAMGCCPDALSTQQVWREVRLLNFIPKQKEREKKTVVTPYVYDCFGHLKLGAHLVKVAPSRKVEIRQQSLGQALHLTTAMTTESQQVGQQKPGSAIHIGDVLAVKMDDVEVSEWQDEPSRWKTADECWYVLVQGIHIEEDGRRSFDIIWLYKPSDTTCAKMKYPYSRELFLSENCSCSRQRIPEDEVLGKASVSWYGSPNESTADFFVRQTYLDNNSFVSLQECHFQCGHIRGEVKTPLQVLMDLYKVGDTVLFTPPSNLKSTYGLEPGEILDFVQIGEKGYVKLRRLYRRQKIDGNNDARPNELVYSKDECTVQAKAVQKRCFVRFYKASEVEDGTIPPPYNRDGTGNAFYVSTQLRDSSLEATQLSDSSLEAIHPNVPDSLIEGPDYASRPKSRRLRGLDLYCGGGNFGRGLEEGGAVYNTHAVDLNENAIHTYHANLENPGTTNLYCGSVNDLLADALHGNPSKSTLVPLTGDIDFISAGSPCPGFSILNSNKDNEKGLRDQSLVASVAAYIDVYRPKYALLENVISMARKERGRDEDVLSQLICCIVGMGYQVQVFNLDAWSFGSPQSRSRLFVSVAAPGQEPMPHPSLSHTHPTQTNDRGLGKMANGAAFGERKFDPAPFKYVTARDATEDLPDIGDARTSHCTWHPDHRMTRGITRKMKNQIEAIPLNPSGMTYAKAVYKMTLAEQDLFRKVTKNGSRTHGTLPGSKSFGRINPNKLFPTVATMISPACSRTGTVLHWEQQRLVTILEARRAQGFPDSEVITGLQQSQWRIIGNSVARTVSLALGISIGEAWDKTLRKESVGSAQVAKVESNESETCPSVRIKTPMSDSGAQNLSNIPPSEEQHRCSLEVTVSNAVPLENGYSSTPDAAIVADDAHSKKRRQDPAESISQPRGDIRGFLEPAIVQEPEPSTLDVPTEQQPMLSRSDAPGLVPRQEQELINPQGSMDQEDQDPPSGLSNFWDPFIPATARQIPIPAPAKPSMGDISNASGGRPIATHQKPPPVSTSALFPTPNTSRKRQPERSADPSLRAPKKVVDLTYEDVVTISDGDDDAAAAADGEEVIFLSSTAKKRRKTTEPAHTNSSANSPAGAAAGSGPARRVYAPVDNSIFGAYEATNDMLGRMNGR